MRVLTSPSECTISYVDILWVRGVSVLSCLVVVLTRLGLRVQIWACTRVWLCPVYGRRRGRHLDGWYHVCLVFSCCCPSCHHGTKVTTQPPPSARRGWTGWPSLRDRGSLIAFIIATSNAARDNHSIVPYCHATGTNLTLTLENH